MGRFAYKQLQRILRILHRALYGPFPIITCSFASISNVSTKFETDIWIFANRRSTAYCTMNTDPTFCGGRKKRFIWEGKWWRHIASIQGRIFFLYYNRRPVRTTWQHLNYQKWYVADISGITLHEKASITCRTRCICQIAIFDKFSS